MLLDAGRRLPHATALSMCAMNALARRGLRIANPIVRAALSSPAHRPFSGVLLVLSYSGRRSGRAHSLPLQYARHGDDLVVMAGTASQKSWWRNFREPAPVGVTLAGKTTPWVARVLSGQERDGAFAAYAARFPRMNTREDVEFVGLSPD
jgi:deazaflavin-dependent oxidoreductase (nitroreductase family)